MKKIWKKIIVICCVAVMLVTLPGVYVLADEATTDLSLVTDAMSINDADLSMNTVEDTTQAPSVAPAYDSSNAINSIDPDIEIEVADSIIIDESDKNGNGKDFLDSQLFEQSTSIGDVTITVCAEEGTFPADAILVVESLPANIQEGAVDAVNEIRDETLIVAESYTFDVKVLDAIGNELQPAENRNVSISFEASDSIGSNLELDIYHLSDEGEAEYLDNDGFESNSSSSYFTVEFTYAEMQYVMQGATSVNLADILEDVGLTGNVTNVECSNEELFSANYEDNGWIVTSHKAFSSAETMKVTIDGIVYEIVVTDARTSITAQEVVNYMNSMVGQNNAYIGYCLAFVTQCWVNMGFQGSYNWGTAKNFADHNTVSTSRNNIPVGANVYFYDTAVPAGHIGIYVGDGYFVHAGSKSQYEKSHLSETYYSNHYTGWGWYPGVTVIDPTPIVTNINNCTITLSPTSYTYNGSAKTPSVTVKNGSTTLSSGTDYTVSYSNNVNAGTATVTVTGKGNYTGSASRTFTINKAAATLSFAEASINKTDLNTSFTNALTRTTDGTVRFSSSNTEVAIVNAISGQVTTVGVGTTTITVTATEGNNYKTASASYTLLVGISVGSNVLATFDKDTGAVEFYSNGGTLWRDWVDKIGIKSNLITSIKVKSGTVYLPTNASALFAECYNLTSLELSRFNTNNVTDMSKMFYCCNSLTSLNLSNFNTSNVTTMEKLFCGCNNLTNLNLGNFNTSNVTDMEDMFCGCSSLTNLDLSSFNTSNVTEMNYMFRDCKNLAKLDLSGFDTAKVNTMNNMFCNCSSLTILDLSSFKTSNVTDMTLMFNGCSSLTNLDLSGFDTAKVTNMYYMFGNCSNLINLNLSGFNTSSATYLFGMFGGCSSLTNLDLSSFNTSNVDSMGGMFSNCSSLKKLDLSSFNTSNVTEMHSMFNNCSSLINLDLSSFDTSKVTTANKMFEGCKSLEILSTPKKNNKSEVALPLTMYDIADKAYTELPILSKSIVLTKNHSIQSYNLTLSPTSYSYDGNAKKPSVTVKKGTTTLTKNTDYTVAYSKNINAGTAKVTVTGKGNYTGTITKTFTIAKATPTLKFASSSLSKKTGDAAFTNALTKTTDGTVTFKSSDTSVATVNSTSGKVTIKGVGTVAITATAEEGTNYKSGNVSYTLTVTAPSPAGFSDVQDPSHPYYKAIYWAAEAGITKGYSDGTFGINRACTRSEAVMFLWRLAGKPAPVDALSSPFKDVPKSHAHYKAILWAAQKGITKGYSDGTFGINKTCTRGQIMTFIWRFKGQPAPKAAAKSPFSDVPKNHAYYKAILWGSQNKITNGFSDGTFGINKNCTRGQIVTFLYRAK